MSADLVFNSRTDAFRYWCDVVWVMLHERPLLPFPKEALKVRFCIPCATGDEGTMLLVALLEGPNHQRMGAASIEISVAHVKAAWQETDAADCDAAIEKLVDRAHGVIYEKLFSQVRDVG